MLQFTVESFGPEHLEIRGTKLRTYKHKQVLFSMLSHLQRPRKDAAAAERTFSRHLWYLKEKVLPLSLFSSTIDAPAKEAMRAKLLQEADSSSDAGTSRLHYGLGHGKPALPLLTEAMVDGDVSGFVTRESSRFIEITGISNAFVSKTVSGCVR